MRKCSVCRDVDKGGKETLTPKMDRQTTTVVDVTYDCNGRCRYCRWGGSNTPGRTHQDPESILIPDETLKALGSERIVLSGGEPLLYPSIEEIARYFGNRVESTIIVTNSLILDDMRLRRLLEAGVNGFTVSLDSMSPRENMLTRGTTPKTHAQIIDRLVWMVNERRSRGFELGLNSVVSSETANWETVSNLLVFADRLELDFVKFNPVFDDGYLTRTAPELALSSRNLPDLLNIAMRVREFDNVPTNPHGFWGDLVMMVSGEKLPSKACGLGPRQTIVVRGELMFCYWMDTLSFGPSSGKLNAGEVAKYRKEFGSAKLGCRVKPQCFCLQSLSHVWLEGAL